MCTTNLELQKARRVLASIRVLTMAVSTALKEKSSSSGCQLCSIERLVSRFGLPFDVIPIDSASRKCRDQDEYRRDDACRCTLDFERGHYHGTLPPLRSSSPPKYPAAATKPDASNIKIRYRHSPVRDIASLTINPPHRQCHQKTERRPDESVMPAEITAAPHITFGESDA